MKRVKLTSTATREELLGIIADSDLVNDRVKFDETKGKPRMHVKEKGTRLKIRCEMIGGPTKDNGFIEGTYFIGTLKEQGGVTSLSGMIMTAPIYHLFIAAIMVVYVLRSISLGGFNPVPLLLLVFNYMLFKKEFDKQGTIERYLIRAFKRADKGK